MSGNSNTQTTTRMRVPEMVRIVHWPLRDGGPWVWMAGFGITVVGVVAGVVSEKPLMGVVCFVTMMLSCWRIWLPVTYELGTKGITQSTLVFHWRIPWRYFARYETRHRGVWLLNDAKAAPFSTLRGTYVPWSDQAVQVRAVLDFFLAARRHRTANTTQTYKS